ncbi:MAG TPA: PBP1A family penicillin-binding protein [Vicinamibacterales bacterium]|nr:PBP1A family penicillin-binding protein [Vicinamibacterales bacterium]
MEFFRSLVRAVRGRLAGRPRVLVGLIAVAAIVCLAALGSLAWFGYDLTSGMPGRAAIRGLGDMDQATTIFDEHDKAVFTIYKEQRIEVPLEKISPNMIQAVLSVEDQRFYEHSGVDLIRIGAAFLHDLHVGRRAEGGSTITQQLARQSFLSADKTFRRKLKEVILAARIEHQYSKHDILELYLNKVYFGDGLYGVEAASRGYFDVPASDLTVAQAALLAGLIQSPSSYAPTVNLDRAIARRNVVLQTMVASGAIAKPVYEQARHAAVTLTNGLELKETFGRYFKEQVRRELVDRFGWQRVYQGGLAVYTTLDPKLQQEAEKVVERGLQQIEHRRGYKHPVRDADAPPKEGTSPQYLQGALVSLDPATGEVRALVGGRDFDDSRFNRATQAKRQAGSAFKPFVYAAALEAGYTPATLITNLNDPILTDQGDWVPDDENLDATSMTVRTALRTSSNRAAVQVLDSVGIAKAVAYAQKLNVGTPPSVPSLALGAGDVTLLSLTAAYGAFADKGLVHTPEFIRRVVDNDGKVLFEAQEKSTRAISESTAYLMSSILADVVNAGTGYRARQVGFTLPAAGKTGTTNDYNDAWFIGYTPHLATGVWVGFDQPQTIVRDGYAADLAVPIWASFMKSATKGSKPDWFDRPSNVIAVNVCRLSGKLPNAGCDHVQVALPDGTVQTRSMVYTEYFVKGTQPTTMCPLHPGLSLWDRFAGAFGKDVGKPTPVDAAGLPADPASTTGVVSPGHPSNGQHADQPKKKRGFWKRLFGIGDDDGGGKPDQPKPKKPGGGR